MKEPTPELIAEINALQSMCTEEIRKRYAALLGVDLERCMNCSELRAGIAYKLQERFYGMSIPADVVKALDFPRYRADFPEEMLSVWRDAMLRLIRADFDAARYLPALEKVEQLQSYFPDDRDAQDYRRKIIDARDREKQNGK